ncbi:pyridoxal 5'-phosphate synthase [Kribbella antibiotica]|uniref:Pyridoxal 5'-phosphate synthase n=1 Tax=Kribbella antibiotica TaxID=190195 RepID=A0A4R4YZF0_9ACTN|nr:pyridoxal 5'-phosphate synthase [Kribbella antibiotica]TDD49112.1 pyridoxal 5'-phosphate synthase [Kribbella antibiotica]
MTDLRTRLRAVPTLTGAPPQFDPAAAPESPHELFVDWLLTAVDQHVPEPLAATVSTVRTDGRPNARVLILKDVTEAGWQFASTATAPKGTELAASPYAALTFYWIPLGRQVRILGQVEPAAPDDSARDFLSRPVSSRAMALAARQSDVLADPAEVATAVAEQTAKLTADPGLVAADWTLYTLRADEVEFWQADPDRRHLRLRYRLTDTWTKERLWP